MTRWIIAGVMGAIAFGAVFLLYRQEQRNPLPVAVATPPASEAAAAGGDAGSSGAAGAHDGHGGHGAPAAGPAPLEPPPSPLLPAGPRPDAARLIAVDFAWARESIPGRDMTAAYLILTNAGDTPDRLIAARSSAAGLVEIHETVQAGGVMSMRPVRAVDLDPGVPVAFEPGGLHLMVMDLPAPLKAGDILPLELDFEHAGRLVLSVPVGEPAENADGTTP